MCGLVGIIDAFSAGLNSSDKKRFMNMLLLSTARGLDSTGAFGVHYKVPKVDYYKHVGHPFRWLSTEIGRDFMKGIDNKYRAVIGHTRLATVGQITPENAHPFKVDHITMVHNGTLRNFDKLKKNNTFSTNSDSEMLCWLIANKGIKAALDEVEGAYAIIYYDEKEDAIFIIRNTERPLVYYLSSNKDKIYIASEADTCLAGIGEWTTQYKEKKHFEPGILYKIPMKNMGGKIKFEEEEIIPPIYTPPSNSHTYNHYGEKFKAYHTPNTQKAEGNKTTIKLGDTVVFDVNSVAELKEDKEKLFVEGVLKDKQTVKACALFHANNTTFWDLAGKYNTTFMYGRIKYIDVSDNGHPKVYVDDIKFFGSSKKSEKDPVNNKIVDFVGKKELPTLLRIENSTITIEHFNRLAKEGCFRCNKEIKMENASRIQIIAVKGDKNNCNRLICEDHSEKKEVMNG